MSGKSLVPWLFKSVGKQLRTTLVHSSATGGTKDRKSGKNDYRQRNVPGLPTFLPVNAKIFTT